MQKRTPLRLRSETIRQLTNLELARGAGTNAAPGGSGAPATLGATECKSEATGCVTYAVGWSCINASCC